MRNLFIDIETIPGAEMPALEDIKVPGNIKKAETAQKYKKENQVEIWKKQALKSLEGRILCIGYAFDDEPAKIITGTEEGILRTLDELIEDYCQWIGHNISTFDIPFIYNRAVKYGLELRHQMPKGGNGIFDTMKEWSPTFWQEMPSLDSIAKFLDIGGKEGMSGKDVFDYWQAGKLQEIYNYCKSDVELTREIYNRLK